MPLSCFPALFLFFIYLVAWRSGSKTRFEHDVLCGRPRFSVPVDLTKLSLSGTCKRFPSDIYIFYSIISSDSWMFRSQGLWLFTLASSGLFLGRTGRPKSYILNYSPHTDAFLRKFSLNVSKFMFMTKKQNTMPIKHMFATTKLTEFQPLLFVE